MRRIFLKKFLKSDISTKLDLIKKILRIFEDHKDYKVNILHKSPFIGEPEEVRRKFEDISNVINEFLKETANLKNDKDKYLKVASDAQTYIGICYEYGIFGFSKSAKSAFYYYNTAGRDGNALSIYKIATCYEKGLCRAVSFRKAITYFRLAAKLGLIEALHTYACVLIYGAMGQSPKHAEGFFYMKMAVSCATSEYPYACFDLAQIYEGKIIGGIKDIDYSLKLYNKGASLGCPNCQNKLGRIYEYGLLRMAKNINLAINFYKTAAGNGHINSQVAMSAFYFTGYRGLIEKDNKTSYKYILRAALQGDHKSAYTLAGFIENGIGTKKNTILSLHWYNIAYNLGNHKAKAKVDEINRKLSPNRRRIEKSWFMKIF